ncbi:UDP-N-acetylglucosamine--N-acetylmuramyl-(pentapeptide) pyrophosphoryl-undecaprenol N-acetylglucosamine transferase [Azospirillaceae bacterium]
MSSMTASSLHYVASSLEPIVLAAGGTGGHMFPAEALARELLTRGQKVALITDRRGGAFGEQLPEVTVHRIRAATIAPGWVAKARMTADILRGYFQAHTLLRSLRPAAVIGFGGYPSVPTVWAAQTAGLPVMLHEQNAVLGRANRMLIGRADVLAGAFPEIARLRPADRAKLIHTGNPVRPDFADFRRREGACDKQAEEKFVVDPEGPLRILILGGSQGARILSEIAPAAMARLPIGLRRRLKISQQCRPEDLESAGNIYAQAGMSDQVELSPFFRDVPARLAACHLAICRAGASTIAELTAIGRPSLLVPYPYAMDDHQTANARALEAGGGGWLIPQETFSAASLAARLEILFGDSMLLAQAAAAARAQGTAEAAARLADAVLSLAAGNPIENLAIENLAAADRVSSLLPDNRTLDAASARPSTSESAA